MIALHTLLFQIFHVDVSVLEAALDQLGVHENHHASDIVDYFFFFLPHFCGFPDNRVRSLFGLTVFVKLKRDLTHLFVGEELPDAVRSDNYYSVILVYVVNVNFYSKDFMIKSQMNLPGSGVTPTDCAT